MMRSKPAAAAGTPGKIVAGGRLVCAKCESRLDIPENPTNEMIISCKACGTPLGTWAEVKDAMKTAAQKIA